IARSLTGQMGKCDGKGWEIEEDFLQNLEQALVNYWAGDLTQAEYFADKSLRLFLAISTSLFFWLSEDQGKTLLVQLTALFLYLGKKEKALAVENAVKRQDDYVRLPQMPRFYYELAALFNKFGHPEHVAGYRNMARACLHFGYHRSAGVVERIAQTPIYRKQISCLEPESLRGLLADLSRLGHDDEIESLFAKLAGFLGQAQVDDLVTGHEKLSQQWELWKDLSALADNRITRQEIFVKLVKLKDKIDRSVWQAALARVLTNSSQISNSVLVPAQYLGYQGEDRSVLKTATERDTIVSLARLPAALRQEARNLFKIRGDLKGWYMLPMKTEVREDSDGRSFFAGDDPAVVLKGVGSNKWRYIYRQEGSIGMLFDCQQTFQGGLFDQEVNAAQTRIIRQQFRKVIADNPELQQLAARFQAREDVFFTPEVCLKPKMVPIKIKFRQRGQSKARQELLASLGALSLGNGLYLTDRVKVIEYFEIDEEPMEVAGEDASITKNQIVSIYSTVCGLRQMHIDRQNPGTLKPFFSYYGYDLERDDSGSYRVTCEGQEVDYNEAAGYILQAATVRHRLALAAIHQLGMVVEIKPGGIFSNAKHNTNPISLFDYDTITESSDPEAFAADLKYARTNIVALALRFGLDLGSDYITRAEEQFDQITTLLAA
ncbi:MAG: hypothetical protein ABH823_05160, partial [bacterium]